jgi:hypothetical protein
MKTTLKQITAGTFIALLFLVGNAKATEIKATSLKAVETTLQLENWMTDEVIWNTTTFNITDFTQETEANLELENWMTNAELWNINTNFVEETESGLELEDWMTNEETWNAEDTNVEPNLTVEFWMINSKLWE